MPAQQESWIATAYLESGTITRGYVACLNEAGTAYIVASAANRTAAGRRSACIALTSADASSPGGSGFEAQYVGSVPTNISGLTAGSASLIRVSDAGVLERVGSYSTSDDVCGYCDADGNAYVCFPLVGLGAALGASSAPGLPQNSVQYYLDANTLGGAAHASISSDGYIEHSADRTGGAATLGDSRFAKQSSMRARSLDGTRNVTVWSHGADLGGGDVIVYGSASSTTEPNENGLWPRYFSSLQVGVFGASEAQAAVLAFGPGRAGATGTGATARVAAACPNFFIGRQPRFAALTDDPVAGAVGVEFHEDMTTAPNLTPSGGYMRRSNPTTHHPEVLLPGDNPSTGWRDLLEEAGTKTITASPAASLDMAGYGHLDIRAPSGVVNIKGFIAPSGRAKRFTITNNNQDSADVKLKFDDAGASATADRIWSNSSADITIPFGDTLLITYSASLARWTAVKGV